MRVLHLSSAIVGLLAWAAIAAAQRPPDDAQARAIEDARQVALNYSQTLPDFLCTQDIRRYVDWRSRNVWVPVDTLTVQVSFFRQNETYKLVQQSGRPAVQSYESIAGVSTRGEFGSTLRWVFDPASKTDFESKGAARIAGHNTSVYAYRVDAAQSRYKLSAGDSAVIAGYHGRVFIEPATNQVLRVTTVADIPARFPIRESTATVDYNYVQVDGREYLLPVRAETQAAEMPPGAGRPGFRPTPLTRYRNVTEFRSYRKFAVDSQLKFDTEADADVKPAPAKK
jgi:hypothetical protein